MGKQNPRAEPCTGAPGRVSHRDHRCFQVPLPLQEPLKAGKKQGESRQGQLRPRQQVHLAVGLFRELHKLLLSRSRREGLVSSPNEELWMGFLKKLERRKVPLLGARRQHQMTPSPLLNQAKLCSPLTKKILHAPDFSIHPRIPAEPQLRVFFFPQ